MDRFQCAHCKGELKEWFSTPCCGDICHNCFEGQGGHPHVACDLCGQAYPMFGECETCAIPF